MAYYDQLYNLCVLSCSTGDFACNGKCFREYTQNLELCPCQSGCPNGCPCEVYECPESTTGLSTTTANSMTTTAPSLATDVLVLSTINSDSVPIITNANEKKDRNFFFLYGEETEVKYACSLTWMNELYVFGESSNKKQISELIGCQLKNIGELAFNLYYGACANVDNTKLYLCFNSGTDDYNKCRVATSPTGEFNEINRSSHYHRATRIAASKGELYKFFSSTICFR